MNKKSEKTTKKIIASPEISKMYFEWNTVDKLYNDVLSLYKPTLFRKNHVNIDDIINISRRKDILNRNLWSFVLSQYANAKIISNENTTVYIVIEE